MLLIRTNPFKNAISSASENVVNWGRRVVVLVDSFWKLFNKSSKVDVGPLCSFLFFDTVNISSCGVLLRLGAFVDVVVVVDVVDFIWIGIRVDVGRCKRRCWQIQKYTQRDGGHDHRNGTEIERNTERRRKKTHWKRKVGEKNVEQNALQIVLGYANDSKYCILCLDVSVLTTWRIKSKSSLSDAAGVVDLVRTVVEVVVAAVVVVVLPRRVVVGTFCNKSSISLILIGNSVVVVVVVRIRSVVGERVLALDMLLPRLQTIHKQIRNVHNAQREKERQRKKHTNTHITRTRGYQTVFLH